MNIKYTLYGMLLAAMPSMLAAQEKTPAFPGAEGFGRYTTGGRGGNVYHVTNLDDSGTGSLRWALNQNGAKTIVFDVSGTIHLKSALNINKSNVTIAGQTAPGDGICIADYPVSVSANNVIVRYMRFRLGNNNVKVNGADGWDGFGGLDQSDIIIDHCSVSWSIDECMSFCGNKNATVQWCLVAQSLQDAGHSKGSHGYGGNWGGSGASFHHNLMAHHESRMPRLGPRYTTQLDERMDMRNNVFYNWAGNGCYGGEAQHVNIVNNYYKPGPGTAQISSTKQKRIASVGIRTESYIKEYSAYAPTLHVWGKYFVDGNVNSKYSDVAADNWKNGMYNQVSASADNDRLWNDEVKDSIRLSQPIDYILTTTHTAEKAYEKVLAYAGASLSRDSYDAFIVDETRNGLATYTGSGNHKGIIDSQEDNKPAGAGDDWSAWPTLNSTTAPTDTDGDGMPDEWEKANGLNANDAKDGAVKGNDGYTNLERYLNSLVADITEAQLADGVQSGSIIEEEGTQETSIYEISPETSNGDWTFTNGLVIRVGNGYAEGSAYGMKGIKFSRNANYKIILPEGVTVTQVDVTGYSNNDTESAYIQTLGSNTFAETEYVLLPRKGANAVTHEISLAVPATGECSFIAKGQQIVANLKLHAGVSAIRDIHPDSDSSYPKPVYSIDGRLIMKAINAYDIESLPQGIYIVGKRKVVVK